MKRIQTIRNIIIFVIGTYALSVLGGVLLAAGNWAYLFGLGLVFAISAMILNFVLYRSKLVPRWLSGLGFAGAVLVFANFLLEAFGINPSALEAGAKS
jgi:hypothetical protein